MEKEIRTIYGPPGTGKTRTLVEYAERESELHPGDVLFVSFSKAAAGEATSRLTGIKPSTLHSCAYRAIDASPAMVVNRTKMFEFSRLVGVPVSGAEENTSEEQQEGDQYVSVMSYGRNQLISPQEAFAIKGSPGTLERFEMFNNSYIRWKEAYGYIDFNDMLTRGAEYVKSSPVVMVDEAQDCSPLQWAFIERLTRDSKRVYVAGDDDQAIFEWSGADPHGMQKFSDRVKSKMRVLDQSYRVPELVHGFVHDRVLDRIITRVPKVFKPRSGDAGKLLNYESMEKVPLLRLANKHKKGSVMILVRDRYRMAEARAELDAENLPYRIVGDYSPWTNRYADGIRAIANIQNGGTLTKAQAEAVKYFSITAEHKHWREVIPVPIALRDFYSHADLSAPINVTLSTIHQSKGKEADAVVVDLTLGDRSDIESINNPDAERRVMYVAMTRAKQELHLCGENNLI